MYADSAHTASNFSSVGNQNLVEWLGRGGADRWVDGGRERETEGDRGRECGRGRKG